MDPLSVTASIIAVLQLTGEVIKYLHDVNDATEECQRCTTEASNLQSLLINLLYHLNQGKAGHTWYTRVRALNVENGPLDQYKQALEELRSRVETQSGIQKVKRRLLWKFSKEEVASILARMERLKSLVSIALEMDHFTLSLAIHEDVVAIQDKQNLQWDAQKLQQHNTIMQWLSPTNFLAQQHDIISKRQKGTGQWFLDAPEFKRWLQGSDKTLFCPGIPGTGKTMMAAITIDHLHGTISGDDIAVACLFCSYKAKTDQSASSLFAALLKQLIKNRPEIAAPVTQIYELHSERESKPSFSDILQALQSVFSAYTTIFIIVDALDECSDKDGDQGQLIDKLHGLQAGKDVRLLFTSRPILEITRKFGSKSTLEIRASEGDLKRYVAGQTGLAACIRNDEELQRTVQSKIIKAVNGMFLLARLQVDSLCDTLTKKKVLSMLEEFSKRSAATNDARKGAFKEAYDKAIERINGQQPGARSLARSALSWLTYAKRPLTPKELCHALAVEPGDKALNTDNVYEVEDIISVCAGLVTVDEESSIVRLVHYTTQEYFEQIQLEWIPGARQVIAEACLTYLLFDTFQSGSCTSDEAYEQRLTENQFLDYSAYYWSDHVRPVERCTSTCNLALDFLSSDASVNAAIQAALARGYKYSGYSKGFPSRTTGLHLTARYGLLHLTERLLRGEHEDSNTVVDSKDTSGRTPLWWAAEKGHEAVVKLLLETGKVDADYKDRGGRTPPWWAAMNGHEAVVKLLLETGKVDGDLKDRDSQTPL